MDQQNNVEQPDKPVVVLENATFRNGRQLTLEESNWIIRPGEVWGVLEDAGSSRSALGDALINALPVVSGKRRYPFLDEGEEPTRHDLLHVSLKDHRSLLQTQGGFMQARWNSLVEEANSVQDFLSLESIYLVSPYQIPDENEIPPDYQQRFSSAVEAMRIQELLSRQIMALSNGEGRKVLIAKALIQQPKLLVLDEAYVGLDAASRDNLDMIVKKQAGRGTAVVLISANERDIPAWCHRRRMVRNDRLSLPIPRVVAQSAEIPLPELPALPASRRRNDPAEVIFSITNGTIKYGEKVIFDRLSWTIRKGENWALLGPNGAGKSTLISLITADNPQAYANRIILFDRERGSGESIWDIKSRIGLISPELQMYFNNNATVLDTVLSGLDDSIGVHHASDPEGIEKARFLLAAFGFENRDSTLFGELSIGEQRMLLLARSLIKDPEILILDEPCQGLDQTLRPRLLAYVDWIGRSGSTQLVYVTHRPEEIPPCVTQTLRLG